MGGGGLPAAPGPCVERAGRPRFSVLPQVLDLENTHTYMGNMLSNAQGYSRYHVYLVSELMLRGNEFAKELFLGPPAVFGAKR